MVDEAPGAALLSEERQHEHEDGGWNLYVPTCFPFLSSSTTSSKSTTHKKKTKKNYLLLLLLLALALVAVLSRLNLFPPPPAVAVSSASLLLGVEEQDQQEEQGKRKRTSIEDDIDDGTIIMVMRPHDDQDDAAGGREKEIPSPTTTVVRKSALDYADVVGTSSTISDSEDATRNKITKNKDNPPTTTTPVIRASMIPERGETNPSPHGSNNKERGGNLSHPATSIIFVPKVADGEDTIFRKEEGGVDHHVDLHGGSSRQLQQENNDCALSEEQTPFVFEVLVQINSTENCTGLAADGTLVVLSTNDKRQLEDIMVDSYTMLKERYCDPYFRNVSSVNIVRQGVSPSSSQQGGQGSSLTLEIQVLGTLRCRNQSVVAAQQQGCNVNEIGLFDFPQDQQGNLQDPASCWCPKSSNDTTSSIIASNRGPTEAEFMEYFGLRFATVAPSLDCPDLQVAECAFGTIFQSALVVTFPDPEAARNASELIGPLTLRTLNDLYKNVSYADFRIFQTVSVVFQEEARRQLQETGDSTSIPPSSSPGIFPVPANTSSLVNGTDEAALGSTNSSSTSPSESPTVDAGGNTSSEPLTAILYIIGACAQCGSDLFFDDDVSVRRRLDDAAPSFFQEAMDDRPSRTLQQAISASSSKSNCFLPIDSVVGEAPVPAIAQFKDTLEGRLQLEITQIQQVDWEGMVVDGSFDSAVYRYPCSDIISTFNKNVTLELQVTCDAAPELSDDDKTMIGSAYANSYNGLRSTVCDPFRLEVTSAKVVESGDLRGGGTSLPLMIEVTVVCYGCDPLGTNVYGIPDFVPSMADDASSTAQNNNETRRYLYAPRNDMKTRREQEQGTCTCNSTLPRRAPLEADVMDAFDLTLLQQEDLIVSCLGNTTTCDFGMTFNTSALFEVELDGSLAPLDVAEIMRTAFTNALNRLIGGGDATQCNSLFGFVIDTEVFLDFVYNSVERSANETARRQLQNLPTVPPTSDLTFMFSWSASGVNTTEAPSAAPTVQAGDTAFFLLDAFGLCNGCPAELVFNDNVNARRRIDELVGSIESGSPSSMTDEFRFLQEITGLEPESECFCPIGSVQIVTDFEQISFLEIIQEEVAKISNATTVSEAVSGITRVECVDETLFSTTINFEFSAFEWVVNNPEDVQGLGNAIASIYNGLVEEFCDEYFRNSVSLTYVVGSLQRVSAQRHDRDLQNTQGCFNYRATFSVAGLCRGCQALGTPIPLFGDSTTTNRKLDEATIRKLDAIANRPSQLVSTQRRLQEEAGSTCICDSTSISQRSAPSREAIRAGLQAMITSLPWAQNPSICGLPVQVEIPCPIIPTGPSTTMTVRFYARLLNNGCLTATDLLRIAADFTTAFNSREQLERFPCEPQYLQVSNVVIDQSTLAGCRRELLRGGTNNDGGESQSHYGVPRQLRHDFSLMPVSMTITGNIWATNLDAILAGEGATLMAAADDITAISGGIYEVYTGRATNTPSAMPSGFPSSFPSAFPSEFPSDEPSKSPSADPSRKPSRSPSFEPTTTRPTSKPSRSPSRRPSADPSRKPSRSPSSEPTTTRPTSKPSRSPSRRPSADPTRKPSRSPSRRPSKSPSADPTTDPSSKPSRSPSVDPSGKPSSSPRPSTDPTSTPSSTPSRMLSKSPSVDPSSKPSSSPSRRPSKSPSADPTTAASSKPSRSPSASPSTSKPSSFPSTNFPSESPSISQPSSVPSTELCNALSDSCTGDLIKVQDWCNSLADPPCCVDGACFWSGEATIFTGTCVGTDACRFASSLTTITVGQNSCNGQEACGGTEYNYRGASINIGKDSCQGDYACINIGAGDQCSVSIGVSACIGLAACAGAAYSANSIVIYDSACASSSGEACSEIAFGATSVTIMAGACTESCGVGSANSCNAFYATGDVTCAGCGCSSDLPCPTDASSCTGDLIKVQDWCNSLADPPCCVDGACFWSGEATISKGACIGTNACLFASSLTTITVGQNSCFGNQACYQIATSGSSVTIGDDSCRGDSACYRIAYGVGQSTSISIGAKSCTADSSCYFVGADRATTVTIAGESCTAGAACAWVGLHRASTVTIGQGSCTASGACYDVGVDWANPVTIGAGSCTDITNACNSVGNFQATSVNIKDSACTAKACTSEPYTCGGTDPGPYLFENTVGAVTCESCNCLV